MQLLADFTRSHPQLRSENMSFSSHESHTFLPYTDLTVETGGGKPGALVGRKVDAGFFELVDAVR